MIKSRARLKDIAEATGFSANTVSLALRGSDRLPAETRERILKAAESLNYFPNRIARSLVHSATRTIGLIMTDIMNPTLTLAARTIERELSKAGYAMMFAASDVNIEAEKRAIELFMSYQVDGMLIYPARHGDYGHIKQVDTNTPVLLLVDSGDAGLDAVAIDDRRGAYNAVRHLCAKGHRNIAVIDGGQAIGSSDKMLGALDAVREAGLDDEAISVVDPKGHAAPHGFEAMNTVMGGKPAPTAIFTSTDSLALGVLDWCRQNSVAVPEDLSVVGYDNTEISQFGTPALTTVNYAADEISRIGVARILQRITGKGSDWKPEVRLIEPELIVRESG